MEQEAAKNPIITLGEQQRLVAQMGECVDRTTFIRVLQKIRTLWKSGRKGDTAKIGESVALVA